LTTTQLYDNFWKYLSTNEIYKMRNVRVLGLVVVASLTLVLTNGCNKPSNTAKEQVITLTKEQLKDAKTVDQKKESLIRERANQKKFDELQRDINQINELHSKSQSTSPLKIRLVEIQTDLTKVLAQAKAENNPSYINDFAEFAIDYADVITVYLDSDQKTTKAKKCFEIASNGKANNVLNNTQKEYLNTHMQLQIKTFEDIDAVLLERYKFVRTIYFGKSAEVKLTDSQKLQIEQNKTKFRTRFNSLFTAELEARVVDTTCDFDIIGSSIYKRVF
jgi:hypothetical protein